MLRSYLGLDRRLGPGNLLLLARETKTSPPCTRWVSGTLELRGRGVGGGSLRADILYCFQVVTPMAPIVSARWPSRCAEK